ncbi:MAG: c-type cytochrome [Leptospiraceae bacterium]|nr:c-type cytochrome [Leptospiraceae bacterium]
MSHDPNKEFDGIRQADNKLPTWYTVSFIGTIIFAVIYLIFYHVYPGDWSQEKQYAAEAKAHSELYASSQTASTGDAGNPFRGDADAIAEGQEIFTSTCSACHGPDGKGVIGPDLTDNQWFNGEGSEQMVFNTVMEGVVNPADPANKRGVMPAHKTTLGATRVWKVIAYLEETNGNIKVEE